MSTSPQSPLIIAHRGASADAPENTLAAFHEAWRQKADGIEADFWLTLDGRVACIHDADLARLAKAPVVVRDKTFDELQKFDVGSWKGEQWKGERIPSLDDVLAILPDDKKLQIELKTGPEIVPSLADAIERSSVGFDQLLLMGFDADAVAACKRRLPSVKCHLLVRYKQQDDGTWTPTVDDVLATVRRVKADGVGSQALVDVFDETFVRKLRDSGVGEFHVWTVDDPKVARFYRRLGALALTTNRPAFLREALRDEIG